MDKLYNVEIYTDGSYMTNSNIGSYACLLICNDIIMQISESKKNVINNQMELIAVIEALNSVKKKSNITVYCDSNYVVENIRHNKIYEWKKNNFKKIKNRELWEKLIFELTKQNIKFKKVKGHSNNKYNEICHAIAYNVAIKKEEKMIKYLKYGGEK